MTGSRLPLSLRVAVFLTTFSGLVFEIGLTRIYSATIWYHFAFVAISIALLGWGLGGMAAYLWRRVQPLTADDAAAASLLYGLSLPVCLWILVRYPFDLSRLPLYFILPIVPFFLAGITLSIVFDANRERASSLYFVDLLGASLGALGVTFLLQALGGEATVLVASAAALVASACLSLKLRPASVVLGIVVAACSGINERVSLFKVVPGTMKAMRKDMDRHPNATLAQQGWNAYSRISAVEGVTGLARLYIDSDAWTSVYPWDGRVESLGGIRDSYRALPFRFEPNAETLVIGPGGGADIVAALAGGSRRVTACEMNPLMLKFVRHYGALAGNLYDRLDVDVVQSEGRNFISRTDKKFDVIFLGFVDSWASVASGGLSLSENYLYTTEAFRDYLEHLTDNGMLVILRWDADTPRLVSNSVALLGAREAESRVAVMIENREVNRDGSDPPQMLFMLKKKPFTTAQAQEMTTTWTPLARPFIVPGVSAHPPYDGLLSGRVAEADYEAASPDRVGPVFDNNPFYFATARPWGMSTPIANGFFVFLFLPSLALLALFVFLGKPRGERVSPYAASVVYFSALGFGFIAVELSLLQHLTLLVGHPIFTLSVLLFTLLAAGGVGSAISKHVPIRAACFFIALLGIAEALALPRLVPALLPLSLQGRVLMAAMFIAPLGILMGMPFPRGLERTGQGPFPPPPFYWGLNGILSVIGSVTTVFIALQAGFQVAMFAGCACYLIAAVFVPLVIASPTRISVPRSD
jgi:predicted membrane-bound spermidine synthase